MGRRPVRAARRAAFVVATVLILAADPAGCEETGNLACEELGHGPENPHISQDWLKAHGEKRIVGKVKHRCSRLVASFNVEIQLQMETEDGWEDMGEPTVNRKVPKVGRKHETIGIYPGCVTGTWRSKVNVVFQENADSDHFELAKTFSAPEHIDCET